MDAPRSLSLVLLATLIGCGGAQTEVQEAPPAPAPVVEAPPPVLVEASVAHAAMQLPLVGTLDPATRIVMGEQTIAGNGDGTFTLSEGEFSAPVPARWVENIVTSLQAPVLGLACPPPRAAGRRGGAAAVPTPAYTITSGETTSTYVEGCTARRVRPDALSNAASDVVGRIGRVVAAATRLEMLRLEAVGQPIPDANFRIRTTELDEAPDAPEGGRTYHRRISSAGDHFEFCTETESDPEATGEGACAPISDVFVAAIAHRLSAAGCAAGEVDASCSAYDDLRLTLENAIEWTPFDLSDVGTQP